MNDKELLSFLALFHFIVVITICYTYLKTSHKGNNTIALTIVTRGLTSGFMDDTYVNEWVSLSHKNENV